MFFSVIQNADGPTCCQDQKCQNTQSAVSSPVFTCFTLEELLFTEGLFPEEDDAAVDVTDGDGVTDITGVGVIFWISSPFGFVWMS